MLTPGRGTGTGHRHRRHGTAQPSPARPGPAQPRRGDNQTRRPPPASAAQRGRLRRPRPRHRYRGGSARPRLGERRPRPPPSPSPSPSPGGDRSAPLLPATAGPPGEQRCPWGGLEGRRGAAELRGRCLRPGAVLGPAAASLRPGEGARAGPCPPDGAAGAGPGPSGLCPGQPLCVPAGRRLLLWLRTARTASWACYKPASSRASLREACGKPSSGRPS